MKTIHAFLASTGVLLTTASVMASTVSVSGGQLTYTAASGEFNDVTITLSGSTYTVADPGGSIANPAGAGCTWVNAHTATCTGVTNLAVTLGDQPDKLHNNTSTPMNATGGTHNDQIWGGGGVDIINGDDDNDIIHGNGSGDLLVGGSGNDSLFGEAGVDYLNGGTGADTLEGGGDDDTIDGGGLGPVATSAVDMVSYLSALSAVTIDLGISGSQNTGAASAGTDTISNVQGVIGSAFGDTLTASAQGSVLSGDAGVDYLYGASGNDWLLGGADGDWMYGRAGDDYLEGGPGDDAMTGEEGQDYLLGDDDIPGNGGGNDTLIDGSGNNVLRGDDGNDNIWAYNSRKDVVECDNGTDTATIDLVGTETSVTNCETLNQLGSGAAAVTNAFCPVKAIVKPICAHCHYTGNNAVSLLTYADTQALNESGVPIWQRMIARAGGASPLNPMPPQSGGGIVGPLSAPEAALFTAWDGSGSDTCP